MNRKIINAVIIVAALAMVFAAVAVATTPRANMEGYGLSQISDLNDSFGFPVAAAPFAVIAVMLIVVLVFVNKKPKDTAAPLIAERQKLIEQLKEAEGHFLKHKIDRETFDKISKEKHEALIRVEAEIDSKKTEGREMSKSDASQIASVSADKKNILRGLLEQKQKKVKELDIAEKSYYKRKVDEATFRKISSEINTEIISIEGQINAIHAAEEIEKLKEQLKEGAREIARQSRSSKDRNLQEYDEEVYSQLGFK